MINNLVHLIKFKKNLNRNMIGVILLNDTMINRVGNVIKKK